MRLRNRERPAAKSSPADRPSVAMGHGTDRPSVAMGHGTDRRFVAMGHGTDGSSIAIKPGTKKAAAVSLAVLLTMGMAVQAHAVTVNWEDLTDAQQERAYHQLESENQALREELAKLQGTSPDTGVSDADSSRQEGGNREGFEDTSQGTGASDEGSSAQGEETAEGSRGGSGDSVPGSSEAAAQAQAAQIRSTKDFLTDLSASFNARQEQARTHTNEEVSAMSESDMWDFRFSCAEAERSFYDSYHAAQFDDLNVLYLCSEYCLGLEKQYQAEEIWNAQADSDEANRLYTAGYYNRAYALVELCEYYGLDLASEYQNLKNAVAQMDAMSSEETRNASADPEKVTKVQELLNSLGFLCGAPDGIAGRQTASCIERFQMMYGYEPADGIIDDELISQLTDQLSRRQG